MFYTYLFFFGNFIAFFVIVSKFERPCRADVTTCSNNFILIIQFTIVEF